MKHTGKLIMSNLMLIGCCLGLSSCEKKENKQARGYQDFSNSKIGDPKNIEASIDFWVKSGHENEAPLNKLKSEFEKEYPKIKVNIVTNGSYDDLELKINRAIPAHNTPTMAMCYPDHVSNYIHSNSVLDMTPMIKDSVLGYKEKDQFIDGWHYEEPSITTQYMKVKEAKWGTDDFVKQFYLQGTEYQKEGLYTLPFAKSSECLFYNKDIFDKNNIKVPETWGDMWNLCEDIKDGKYGDELSKKIPLAYDSDANMFITFCKQLNIPYTTAKPEAGKGNILFNNQDAKDMVKDIMEKVDKGYLTTKGLSSKNAHASDQFTKGNIIMTIGSTAGTSYNRTDNFTVGVAKCPAYNNNLKVVTQGPDICIFQNTSDEQRYAAWLFYKFITRTNNSAYYATQSTGYFPVKYSSYETEIYEDWAEDNQHTIYGQSAKLAKELNQYYFTTPVFKGSSAARKAVNDIFGYIKNDQAGGSLDEKVERAFDNAIKKTIL